MKKFLASLVAVAILFSFSGCGSLTDTQKGTLFGTGGGAALGAGIGALIGKGKGAAIGGAVGAIAGGVAGTLIGKHMQKKKEEMAAIQGAQVSTVTDVNGYTALKVAFDSDILFATGKYDLNAASKNSLSQFAMQLINDPNTDVQIYGHTDNTGSRATNEKLSLNRANAVRNYLNNCGVPVSRMMTQGLAYDYPVADNSTAAGRAQNRRVEVYISANEQMIQDAENGKLQ
ncbi:MAG: OmpA family protein [Muribaculaceae bacterium]|nr:OmpA family protein [Muribaculaceae bacterium]